MTKFHKNKINQSGKKFNIGLPLIIKLAGGVLIIVFLLEIWMVNQYTTSGTKLERLQQLKSSLELQNQILENHIAEETSLPQVESKATKLGFTPINQIQYIKSPSLASR